MKWNSRGFLAAAVLVLFAGSLVLTPACTPNTPSEKSTETTTDASSSDKTSDVTPDTRITDNKTTDKTEPVADKTPEVKPEPRPEPKPEPKPEPSCANVGETVADGQNCCDGLTKVAKDDSADCSGAGKDSICIKADDGKCERDKGENRCNSKKDCECNTAADCGKTSCSAEKNACKEVTPVCSKDGKCQTTEVMYAGATCDAGDKCKNKTLCKVDCDCPQGTACLPLAGGTKVCQVSNKPVYCCDKEGCPKDEACVNKAGNKGTCPACFKDENCGKATCKQSGTSCILTTPTCSGGACTAKSTTSTNADCDTKTNKCVPKKPNCKHLCDCKQGMACINGFCIAATKPVYCCSNANCPVGQACENSDSSSGQCPNPCTAAGGRCQNARLLCRPPTKQDPGLSCGSMVLQCCK